MCEMKEKSRRSRCDIPNVNGNTLDRSVMSEVKRIAAKNFTSIRRNAGRKRAG